MTIPIPEGSVVITPIQVYQKVEDTHHAVQQLIGKIDGFVGTMGDHETRLRKLEEAMPDNAESRLRHLETRIAMYSGASGVLGAAAGYLASWVIYHH
jgi:hypothetical protein